MIFVLLFMSYAFCIQLGNTYSLVPADSISKIYLNLREKSFKTSYDLNLARAQLSQEKARTHTAWTRWLPRIDLKLSQTREKDYSLITSGGLGPLSSTFVPQAVSLSRWQFELTAPLFRRSVFLEIQQSSMDESLSELELAESLAQHDWRLRSLLGNYLFQKFHESTMSHSLQEAKTHLRDANTRFELGQRTRVDVLRAEANLALIESRQITLQAQIISELQAFLEGSGLSGAEFGASGLDSLLGSESQIGDVIDQFSEIGNLTENISHYLSDPSSVQSGPNNGQNSTQDSLEKLIVNKSPIYRRLLSSEKSNLHRAKSLMSQEWPSIDLRGSLHKSAQTWNTSFSSGNVSYSVGVVLTVPLFSGGSIVSSYFEKKNAEEQSEIKFERDRVHFLNSLESDRVQIRSRLKALEVQKKNLAKSFEIVRLTAKSYELGRASFLELLGSESELNEAKTSLMKAKLDLASLIRQFAWQAGIDDRGSP